MILIKPIYSEIGKHEIVVTGYFGKEIEVALFDVTDCREYILYETKDDDWYDIVPRYFQSLLEMLDYVRLSIPIYMDDISDEALKQYHQRAEANRRYMMRHGMIGY